jgi:bifunctional DNA-binding transcriptional regulator/antitoxin component of YhaV-PrlF toxin-antitoxin module
MLDGRNAAMRGTGMAQVLPVSIRGTITLPPAYRRKLGLDRMENPLILAEEKDGKLVLEVAAAVRMRDIPAATVKGWLLEDEKAGAALRRKGLLKR